MSDDFCLHCAIVSLIAEHHPGGMDEAQTNEALRCLGMIAGGILRHAADKDAALRGFSDYVKIVRDDPRNTMFSAENGLRH